MLFKEMDEVLTHSNAPPTDDPPTEEESQHYETVYFRGLDDGTLYIDDLLSGFTTMYKHRVSDTFLEMTIKYMIWRPNHDNEIQQKIVNDLVDTATNTDIDLRRLYAFWVLRCHGKITNDIRCYVILSTVRRLCVQWALEHGDHNTRLLWKIHGSWPSGYIVPNRNDLVDQIREFLFHPDRVKRLTYDHIRQMTDPACEN
jgi:hypothetical protein